jgi:hypothetical protein
MLLAVISMFLVFAQARTGMFFHIFIPPPSSVFEAVHCGVLISLDFQVYPD